MVAEHGSLERHSEVPRDSDPDSGKPGWHELHGAH